MFEATEKWVRFGKTPPEKKETFFIIFLAKTPPKRYSSFMNKITFVPNGPPHRSSEILPSVKELWEMSRVTREVRFPNMNLGVIFDKNQHIGCIIFRSQKAWV